MTRKEATTQRETIQKMRRVLGAASRRAYRTGNLAHSKECAQVEREAMRLQTQILAEMPYQQSGRKGAWRS